MAKAELPTPAQLRKLIEYNPKTGELTWRPRAADMFAAGKYPAERVAASWNAANAGRPAFSWINDNGYARGTVLKKRTSAHRVAFAIYYGRWPKHEVDHINGVRADNRIANLREATSSENNYNIAVRSDNRTGFKGVSFHTRSGKYCAFIKAGEKRLALGSFPTAELAASAYDKAALELHGQYARTNAGEGRL